MRKIVAILATLLLIGAAAFVPTASAQVGYPIGYGYGSGYGYGAGYGFPFSPFGYAGWGYGNPAYGYGSLSYGFGMPWYGYGLPGFGMGWAGYGTPGYTPPSPPASDSGSGSSGRVCILIYPPPPGC
jgi:hypothetical protein